jgi:nicotinamide phosphoribosyltransferase
MCQWLLRDLWKERFFDLPKQQVLDRYKHRMDGALGLGAVPVDHIGALHDLGHLPLRIKAVPEGSRVDIRVPMFTMINTHPDFYWVTNYLETQISAESWKAMTSASTAYEYRRLIDFYAAKTGSDPAFSQWQGHDFSFRGMSGITDAAQSGAGHLLSFTGTDTVSAIDYLEDYYGGEGLIGGSVPATEHSVACAASCGSTARIEAVEEELDEETGEWKIRSLIAVNGDVICYRATKAGEDL